MNSSGLGLVRLLSAPSHIAFQTESGNAITAMPPCRKLDHENRLRSRANLRSRSRSAVGGYAVSVKSEPVEET